MESKRKKKRGVEDQPSPPEDELYYKMAQMPEPYRSYAAFMYLFGNRVSEALGIKQRYVHKEETYTRINAKGVTKFYTRKVYHDEKKLPGQPVLWLVEPLKRWRISADEETITVLMPTFKRAGRPLHALYAFKVGHGETRFYELLKEQVNSKRPEEYIWTHSRVTQYFYTNKYLGITNHKLRGMRATKDVVKYDLDTSALVNKFNWARPDMAIHYTALQGKDVKDKMRRSLTK